MQHDRHVIIRNAVLRSKEIASQMAKEPDALNKIRLVVFGWKAKQLGHAEP